MIRVGNSRGGGNGPRRFSYIASALVVYNALLVKATSLGYTLPSPSQQALQLIFVKDLMAAGIWPKLDVLRVYATDGDQNFALLNWKNPDANQAVRVGTLTHTTNAGYNNDGVSSYIDEMFDPLVQGVNYKLNNAGKFAYVHTLSSGGASNLTTIGGNAGSNQRFTNANSNGQRINSTGALDLAASFSGAGFKAINRLDSTIVELFNGITQSSRTQTVTSMGSGNFFSFKSGSDLDNGTLKLAMIAFGAPLVNENTAFKDAITTYMTSI